MLQSPFFTSKLSLSKSRFEFSFSSFKFATNKIIFAQGNTQGIIRDSHFSNILTGAIKIDGLYNLNDKINSHRQVLSNDHFIITNCVFESCVNMDGEGGAIESNMANFTVSDTSFFKNKARIGGAAHILRSWECKFERVVVCENEADFAAGIHYDSMNEQNTTQFYDMNLTRNTAAKWTGAFRIDHGGGKLFRFVVEGNKALVASGYLDYTWQPTHRILRNWLVRDNNCTSRAAGITIFHIRSSMEVHDSVFLNNQCEISANSISVENVDGYLLVDGCYFTGKQDEEVSSRFGETMIKIDDCHFEKAADELEKKWNEGIANFQTPAASHK